jgi:type I restriction-modification system DNA methylase subunit
MPKSHRPAAGTVAGKPARAKRPVSSEVHAYGFIHEDLKERGWDTRNPSRHPGGRVWTQNECLTDTRLRACLGTNRPENVVKITESVLWVIEAKPEHRQIDRAVEQAIEYAEKVTSGKQFEALFISGVAGNPTDSYVVQTHFRVGRTFRPITLNGKSVTSLISPEIARTVLESGPDIKDVPIDEALFVSKAERINQYLHLGAINKNSRARVMAALLLAIIEDPQPNIDAAPSVLINDINGRARRVLKRESKENFFKYIEIALPPTEDNHAKFKTALVRTIQELNNLNIRSAMNSGTDVLGKFYEVFLKYGNGAKEIGIVLTPRHITKFAVDVVGVTNRDVVYDPTCGTAGFLVAAFDHVRQHYKPQQVNAFKQKGLFGVEQEAEVVALAIVNMIFRGDGKNNIVEGNCFQKNLVRNANGAEYSPRPPNADKAAVTRVLMNPPFALKSSDEKEYKFVDQGLRQLEDGGVLFAILPYSAMVRPGGYRLWREGSLLKNHTLLSVFTLPPDLFYPIGVHTLGIFVQKGTPHPPDQPVLWVRASNDGLLKSKGKRLPSKRATNDFAAVRDLAKAFLANPALAVPSIERFQKAAPIDFSDSLLELVPENYLDQAPPTPDEVREGIEQVIRDSAAFVVRERLEGDCN